MKSKSESSFSIYRSSAGSGKTYQLALEYISIAIGDPNSFNKILAVTFTNKATKEMKDRVLEFLVKLSLRTSEELSEQVRERTGLSEKDIAANAGIVVGKILHQYSQFSISTIDAFFQKIVKSFAKELGLLGNFKVELDQEKVKQEIIDQIIDEVGVNQDLTDWLIDFSYSKVDENRSWNIRPQIESLANEIFKESFRQVSDQLSDINHKDFKVFLDQIKKIKRRFEREMKAEATKALELIESFGLSVNDFAYKASGPAGYFNRIIIKNDFDPKARIRQVTEHPEKWSSKSAPRKNEIDDAVASGLQAITINLVNYYNSNVVEYTTANETLKNIYVFGILSHITKKLRKYRQENDVMLISDVPIFLNGIIAENDAPFIYEKTGTWYQNYLIDEFQDTSVFQWQNFKPLMENSSAQGNKSLVVGDGKQSIYRWRGGDWNLILGKVINDLKLYSPQELYLNTNWRSSKKIVEFNNAVFRYLPYLIKEGFQQNIEELALNESEKNELLSKTQDVVKLYEDVAQLVKKEQLEPSGGRIEINAYHKNDSNHWKERALIELPSIIERLQQSGFQPKDIAVLVRKGDEGKKVIEQLIQYKNSDNAKKHVNYDAISNESLYLGNSSAIRVIISTIIYSLNPDDKIAFGEICFNYTSLRGIESNKSGGDNKNDTINKELLPEHFDEVCASLLQLPVYEVIERLIQLYQLGKSQQQGYLQAFQDIVLEYFASDRKDVNDFLEWWHEKGKLKSIQIPASVDAIQVMTIHKSKGLEFKAVLIPFCDWKLDHDATKSNYIWCRTDKKPYDEMEYLPLKYSSALTNSYFTREYFDEMIKAHIDNLNLLYVALTRAKDFLLVNCPPGSKEIKTSGDLLLKGVENLKMSSGERDDVVTYTIGEMAHTQVDLHSVEAAQYNDMYRSSVWRDKIALRKKGGIFFSEEGIEKKEKINYGLIVHEILASIKNEKEATFAIEKYCMDGQISKSDKKTISDQLKLIFSNSQVKSWFNTDWEVKAEASIILTNRRPKRPDRVLIKGNSAIIIDFKTGSEKPEDRRQVLSYTEILRAMGYLKIQAFLLYIPLNKVIQVV